jgi:two-component system sensor histidine kinase KdpD
VSNATHQWPAPSRWWAGYIGAIVLVVLATLAAAAFQRLPHANLSLVFLLAVLIVAAIWGLWPSILGGILGFLSLNFFFTEPRYTLNVAEEGDVATLVFFLAMAALTGNLTARMRTEMATTRLALSRVSTMLDLSRRVAGAADIDRALAALAAALANVYGAAVAVWTPSDSGKLALAAAHGTDNPSAGIARERIDELWSQERTRLVAKDGITAVPLATSSGRIGLVTIAAEPVGEEQRAVTEGLCEQASVAVARIALVDDLKEAQLVSQTEQLRSALLSSVSHDMKTPLASIIGSVTSVIEYGDKLSREDQRELLQTVLDESERLHRYIQNLLDMTRFGQERIEVTREWVDLNDLISAAVARLGSALSHVQLDIDVDPEVSLISVQGALIEQTLVNILDNAAAFSGPGAAIRVAAYRSGDASIIDIDDEGPGVPEEDRTRIFEMFFTAREGDRRRHGAGLGLAICRSIVTAHGGTIAALPRDGEQGTRIRIELPLDTIPVGGDDV